MEATAARLYLHSVARGFAHSWRRARRSGRIAEARIVNLSSQYTLAAYAAPARDATGFVAYAKVFRAAVGSYWDARMPVAKYSAEHVHAEAGAALRDALDVAFMSLINEGAVQSDWPPLTDSPR
jgi:hypothetical protein